MSVWWLPVIGIGYVVLALFVARFIGHGGETPPQRKENT